MVSNDKFPTKRIRLGGFLETLPDVEVEVDGSCLGRPSNELAFLIKSFRPLRIDSLSETTAFTCDALGKST